MLGRYGGMALAGALKINKAGGTAFNWAMKNPRKTMAIAGAAAGGMMGGWEGAAIGASAGALTPRRMMAFGGRTASNFARKQGWGVSGFRGGTMVGSRLGAGGLMGGLAGLGSNVAKSAIGSVYTNSTGMNKPYSTMGSSYGSSMGGAPFGSSFSGMGMRY